MSDPHSQDPTPPSPDQPQQGWGQQPVPQQPVPQQPPAAAPGYAGNYGPSYGQGYAQPSAVSGKGAGMFCLLLALASLLGAVMVFVAISSLPAEMVEQSINESNPQAANDLAQAGMTIDDVLSIYGGCCGAITGLPGLVLLILTPFVFSAKRGAVITAIVFAFLAILCALPGVVFGLAVVETSPATTFVTCAAWGATGLLAIVFLVLAFKLSGRIANKGDQQYAMEAVAQQVAWQSYQQHAQQGPQQGQQPPQY